MRYKIVTCGECMHCTSGDRTECYNQFLVPVQTVRKAKKAKTSQAADAEWQREIATQAGMGLGVDAYNDEMGW